MKRLIEKRIIKSKAGVLEILFGNMYKKVYGKFLMTVFVFVCALCVSGVGRCQELIYVMTRCYISSLTGLERCGKLIDGF